MRAELESLVLLSAAALALSLALTPAARGLARRVGLLDQPDGRRKTHERATPVAGGVAVFASTVVALALTLAVPGSLSRALTAAGGELAGLFLGAAVICLVGVIDDRYTLRGKWKVLGQSAAAAAVLASGVQIRAIHLFGWQLELGWLAVPFTFFWLLGAVNSLNLLDGMDGLLGTIGAIICTAIAVLAALNGQLAEACVAVALAGALAGFLCFNLPPASIFLGDAGSMTVGLVIGVLAVRCSLKGPATVALATPVALLTLPIFDTAAALVRRRLTGRSIYAADRGHLHHCLLRTGLSRPRILLLVSGLCAVTVLGALSSTAYQNEGLALLSAGAVVAGLIATRLFGHAEFVLLLKSCGTLARSLVEAPPGGRQLEVRLQGSAGWGDLWGGLVGCAGRLNLQSIALDVNAPALHEGYHARWQSPRPPGGNGPGVWSAVIPLTAWGQSVGRVKVTGQPDGEPVWRKLAVLAGVTEAVESLLSPAAPAAPAAPARAEFVQALAEPLVGAGPA
jgi:UDP-GlcNAc:undecaprenyl-phosphate GlcNAc-1-phosphate transferase